MELAAHVFFERQLNLTATNDQYERVYRVRRRDWLPNQTT